MSLVLLSMNHSDVSVPHDVSYEVLCVLEADWLHRTVLLPREGIQVECQELCCVGSVIKGESMYFEHMFSLYLWNYAGLPFGLHPHLESRTFLFLSFGKCWDNQ